MGCASGVGLVPARKAKKNIIKIKVFANLFFPTERLKKFMFNFVVASVVSKFNFSFVNVNRLCDSISGSGSVKVMRAKNQQYACLPPSVTHDDRPSSKRATTCWEILWADKGGKSRAQHCQGRKFTHVLFGGVASFRPKNQVLDGRDWCLTTFASTRLDDIRVQSREGAKNVSRGGNRRRALECCKIYGLHKIVKGWRFGLKTWLLLTSCHQRVCWPLLYRRGCKMRATILPTWTRHQQHFRLVKWPP